MIDPTVDAEIAYRRESRRMTWLAAHSPARLCSWCGRYKTPADKTAAEMGAPKSHGICPDCLKEQFPEIAATEDDGWRAPQGAGG